MYRYSKSLGLPQPKLTKSGSMMDDSEQKQTLHRNRGWKENPQSSLFNPHTFYSSRYDPCQHVTRPHACQGHTHAQKGVWKILVQINFIARFGAIPLAQRLQTRLSKQPTGWNGGEPHSIASPVAKFRLLNGVLVLLFQIFSHWNASSHLIISYMWCNCQKHIHMY